MFTGIVTGRGTVLERREDPARGVVRLRFSAPGHLEGLSLGGSIAVGGVCVSATAIEGDEITVDLIAETTRRTTLGDLEPGDRINLERCLTAGDRLDGHIVQGHVDRRARLVERDRSDGRHRFVLVGEGADEEDGAHGVDGAHGAGGVDGAGSGGHGAPPPLVEKGSVAVDGVSLTVTAVGTGADGDRWFEVGLIPTTLAETTLGDLRPGQEVNVEFDVLAKYARRMLAAESEATDSGPPTVAGAGTELTAELAAELAAGPPAEPPADPEELPLDSVDEALVQLAAGRPVVVVDDADRENEGDLILPASAATEELMGFVVRHTSGVVCVPMTPARAAHLDLPPMTARNQDPKGTAYTVTCDAALGITTGISAADRAATARLLAAESAGPEDLTRPGHMLPLIADPAGVLGRPGHTEAAIDLCRMAGVPEVGVIAELVHDDGGMMRLPALRRFADLHGLALISIADLIVHRGGTLPETTDPATRDHLDRGPAEVPPPVSGGPEVTLPTDFGTFVAQAWTEHTTGHEHLLLTAGESGSATADDGPLVRLHSECLTGDVLGSHRCDCGTQLISALQALHRDGGHLLYLRGHEGRGIGLANKLRAYRLQEDGADTVEANEMLGLAAELRDYAGAAAVLRSRGISRLRLLTNNPDKVEALRAAGLVVTQVPSDGVVHEENRRYLRTKRDRMRHMLDHREDLDEDASGIRAGEGSPSDRPPADHLPTEDEQGETR